MFNFKKTKMLGIEKVLEIRKVMKTFLKEKDSNFEKDENWYVKNPQDFFNKAEELYRHLKEKKVLPENISYDYFLNTAFFSYEAYRR